MSEQVEDHISVVVAQDASNSNNRLPSPNRDRKRKRKKIIHKLLHETAREIEESIIEPPEMVEEEEIRPQSIDVNEEEQQQSEDGSISFSSFSNFARAVSNSALGILKEGSNFVARALGETEPPAPKSFRRRASSQTSSLVKGEERKYNLQRVPYAHKDGHTESDYWLLRSGLPFPSYHSNPTRGMPCRWVDIENVSQPVEDLRAPRIRLRPKELEQRGKALEVIKLKALAEDTSQQTKISTLNLSYQDLGEPYQFEQLMAYLDVNRRIRTLALTDNGLLDISKFYLPELEILYISRNQILSWNYLPPLPRLRVLHISYNFISNTNGLTESRFPKLRVLTLTGNPICDVAGCEAKCRSALPSLKVLDTSY